MENKIQFAEKHYRDDLTAADLDQYLARGWYRMGQSIFTTQFLFTDRKILSALWLRLPLEGYDFPKRMRKILNRNRRIFEVVITPSVLDIEKEDLYQKYRANFTGMLSPTLFYALQDGMENNVFNTWEIQLRIGDQLAACSFFDVGEESVTSIMGIYDPQFSNLSLGMQTMLEEIEYARQTGKKFFYPGYVVPGNARFDYKLRIGNVDYYDLHSRNWLPWYSLAKEDYPIRKMQRKLNELQKALEADGYPSRVVFYPLFEARMVEFWPIDYMEFPVFVMMDFSPGKDKYWLVVFDYTKEAFVLMQAAFFDLFPTAYNANWLQTFDPKTHFLIPIYEEFSLFTTPVAKEIVEWFDSQLFLR